MGCLKLTYDYDLEPELFLGARPEKTDTLVWCVWVNPESGFLRVVDQQNNGSDPPSGAAQAAQGVLAFMLADVSILEPTDAVVPKWIVYGAAALISGGVIYLDRQGFFDMSRFKPGLQGGKQGQRDRGTSGYPQDFKRWLHDQKNPAEPDFDPSEIKDWYQEWLRQGQPKPR
jgi:hypothetical protein